MIADSPDADSLNQDPAQESAQSPNRVSHRGTSPNDTGKVDTIYLDTRATQVGYGLALFFVVAGGLVAAVTGPLELEKGSWLAAYLVLIAGVALGVLCRQSRTLEAPHASPGREWAVIWLWLAGNALVVLGALTAMPILTDIGGVALVVVLVLALLATRAARRPALAWLLRAVYVALLVSIPIGLTLTHIRSA